MAEKTTRRFKIKRPSARIEKPIAIKSNLLKDLFWYEKKRTDRHPPSRRVVGII